MLLLLLKGKNPRDVVAIAWDSAVCLVRSPVITRFFFLFLLVYNENIVSDCFRFSHIFERD